jgi:hypothetical protein
MVQNRHAEAVLRVSHLSVVELPSSSQSSGGLAPKTRTALPTRLATSHPALLAPALVGAAPF